MALIVCSLDKALHERHAFDCGDAALNSFLQTQASKHQQQGFSRTFVLTDDRAPQQILAFYSLTNCEIGRASISAADAKGLPLHPVPCVLIARLAVGLSRQGQKLGQRMLIDAIKRTALISQQSGVHAIVVEAKDVKAKQFYERFGFISITEHPMKLYLPLATALKALQ